MVATELKKVEKNVYYKRATATAKIPYVIYRFTTTNFYSEREEVFLEIDIWDIRKDGYDVITAIETRAKNIVDVLKKFRHLDGDMFVSFEIINKLDLIDEDENIERIQLRYRLRKYN